MEVTAGVGAVPNGTLSRKERRAVSEHQSARNVGDEHGQEQVDIDFCSITIDGGLDNDMLQQQLSSVTRQRVELQQVEVELRAQVIARSEILKMQDGFDAQIKEHANTSIMLQEQLREKDQTIHELERKIEEKSRELHAAKLDNEAAWAKEDLLREQNKELATFRRELDNSEFERSEHLQRMHDLQEHIQDKERKFLELQEQNRVAQETIVYKDEQIREAQTWIARVQEMDVFHSSTNHSLQAELRERTEQYNQLWLGCQRQFAEMERLHLHTMQQLQLELADARGKNGSYSDDTHVSESNLKDASHLEPNNGSQLNVNGNDTSIQNRVLPNGNADNVASGHTSPQIEHVPGVPIAQSSLLGMPTYLPPGEVAAHMHPFFIHQQETSNAVPSDIPQSQAGSFYPLAAIPSVQHWHNQQAVSEGPQIAPVEEFPPSHGDQNHLRPETDYNFDISDNGQALHSDYLNSHINQSIHPDSVISSSTEKAQALETLNKGYLGAPQSQPNLQQISSEFHDALRLEPIPQSSKCIESKDKNVATLTYEQPSLVANSSLSGPSLHSVNFNEKTINKATGSFFPEDNVPDGLSNTVMAEKALEASLLDERSLLACVVRTIPPGGRIRISSTLPNRLGKMLTPLHWHDYKKKYGKLDDFVSSHPELFVIEGDHIHLQEGAKEKIAATAAVAKVAAAAAASSPYSAFLPSVAVTPMAQSYRLRKIPSVESTEGTIPNDISVSGNGGLSNVKILSKTEDYVERNGPQSRFGQSAGNGSNQNKGSRNSTNLVGKHQTRASAVAPTSRR